MGKNPETIPCDRNRFIHKIKWKERKIVKTKEVMETPKEAEEKTAEENKGMSSK